MRTTPEHAKPSIGGRGIRRGGRDSNTSSANASRTHPATKRPGQRRLITFGHLSHRGAPCQREQICLPRSGADATVSGIQHVGHVVRDIDGAIALYRRMGFCSAALISRACSASRRAIARLAGNTHISLRRSFVELVTVADDRQQGVVAADATLVPLHAR